MAQAQLGAVVRHLRRLANAAQTHDWSDAQLLQRFANAREEEAFATLVERHGRLVWSTCWQILHHEQDAEDAFQATFLVLARQAGSIRNGRTLPSWLYRVAYRTAMKARVDKSRRHAHERQAPPMPQEGHTSDLGWRELQAVLLEELQRLPEKYRAPFVLCCLEGKSKTEAAGELGWKEGTVSGRLALARKQMQKRLARRGVSLSAVLCGLALRPDRSLALSTALLENTVRAGLLFVGARSAAAGASAAATALARGVLRTMTISKLKTVGLLLLAAGVALSGAGAVTHQALADKTPAAKTAEKESDKLQAKPGQNEMMRPKATEAKLEKAEAAAKGQVAFRGTILNHEGTPLAGAHVAVVAALRLPDQGTSMTMNGLSPEAEVLGLGKTDDSGRFRIHAPERAYARAHAVAILAGATGYGLAAQELRVAPAPADTTVRLAPEEPLTVRLIDLEGMPASGVSVSVVRHGKLSYPASRQYTMAADTMEPAPVFYQDFGSPRKAMLSKPSGPASQAIQFADVPRSLPFWPQPTVTDADGRCTLRGFSRGQVLGIQVRGERFATQNLDVDSPAAPAANAFTMALGAPQLLEGTVSDAASGKPVPNARIHIDTFPDYFGGFGVVGDPADEKGRRYGGSYFVSMGPQICRMDIQADEHGHYRVHPFQGNSQVVTVRAPPGQAYLAVRKNVTWPRGAVRQEVNVALPPGVKVRGRVVETTGKLVADCRIDFWSKTGRPINPFQQQPQYIMNAMRAQSGADGAFETVLPPGKWYLLANGSGAEYLWQKLAADDIRSRDPKDPNTLGVKEGEKLYLHPDGWAAVDVRLDQKPPEATVTLRPSRLEGRVLTPDGKPVARARMYYRRRPVDRQVPAIEISDGRFKVAMPDVNAKYHVLFLDAENGLGAAVDLSGTQAGGEAVAVKLTPCGNATVRFVDEQGKPVAGYRPKVWARIPPYPNSIHINEVVNKAEDFRTDGSVWLARMDRQHYANGPVTDADGRVTLPNLIPGASYQISTDQPSHSFWEQGVDFTVKSGQTKKLADIVLKSAKKQAEPGK